MQHNLKSNTTQHKQKIKHKQQITNNENKTNTTHTTTKTYTCNKIIKRRNETNNNKHKH